MASDFEEFKALCHLIPLSFEMAQMLCLAIAKFDDEHPELKQAIDTYLYKQMTLELEELWKGV